MIEARNLSFGYGKLRMKKDFELRDVSLKIEPGYMSCLLGKNGAGKTTLLSLLYGTLVPKSGEVLWNGKPLNGRTLAEYRREVAYAGEDWCAECMTVDQNVEMLSILYPSFDRKYFDELMKVAGIGGIGGKVYETLSRGERVKTEISFLLARRPKILLLDEPLANVDPVFKVDVLELLQRGVAENETGILISTHLVDEISDVVDYVYVLEQGKLTQAGSRFEVLGEGEKNLRDLMK